MKDFNHVCPSPSPVAFAYLLVPNPKTVPPILHSRHYFFLGLDSAYEMTGNICLSQSDLLAKHHDFHFHPFSCKQHNFFFMAKNTYSYLLFF
jgi:hypothetical protein